MMESVGALPAPDDTLSPKIIPLFGILSTVHDNLEEECHFCLTNIKNNDLFVTKTPCCRHNIHCKCFKRWAELSVTDDDTIRCAYCRTMYPYEEYCFLCLQKKTNNQRLMKTNCCQSTIHNRCVEDLLYILAHLSYEFTLECGQTSWCNCLWLHE